MRGQSRRGISVRGEIEAVPELEKLKSFDEFLAKRFPHSRRKAYVMAIHDHPTRTPKPQLREMGWVNAREPVNVALRGGPAFPCAFWVHKAKALAREEFQREVDRHLTGKETESWGDYLLQTLQKSVAGRGDSPGNCQPDARNRQI